MLYNHIAPEPRPLKRPRLGVPDVYPQEPKQREDELNPSNVKNGFQATQQISEEFGTARNSNITLQRLNMFCISINSKRTELNTLPDNGRKKQQIKDNFWPVTGRSKGVLDMWFRDLAGTKPLANLAKKAPSFNKKEEIFTYLCDHQVSMKKAMWFLKLSAAYTTTVTEQKNKKRQMPDPSIEWTATVIRVMKDLSQKLVEHCILEKNPKMLKSSSPQTTNSTKNLDCSRCSIDRQITPTKCTKEKCVMLSKGGKMIGTDGKVTPKAKSLREKVLNRSLMKDARFREMKLTKRKMSMLGPPPAKRAKHSMRVARMKAASKNRREATMIQKQQQNINEPSTSTAIMASTSELIRTDNIGDEMNAADAEDRNVLKLTRRRMAIKRRNGLPSISQMIADLLAKRAKKRAKQRLNEKSSEQAAATPSTSNLDEAESVKNTIKSSPTFGSSQPVESPSQASTSTTNTTATTSTSTSGCNINSSSSNSSNHTFIAPAAPATPGSSNSAEDFATILKQWKYSTRLCKAMCEESLLDRHEFLQWALELLDRMRNKMCDDGFLKLFLPFILQCLPFIVESERLSRRLAYLVCKKIGFMLQYVTEEDTITNNKKLSQQTSSNTCCDTNAAANRLDSNLKVKQEPEIRAPLATRSASTLRLRKSSSFSVHSPNLDKKSPPSSSEPPSPSCSAPIDSPEDVLTGKNILGANYMANRPNPNQDRKNFGSRPGNYSSSTSPASKPLSSTTSPTASPPSVPLNSSSIMPLVPSTVVPASQSHSSKNQVSVVKMRQKPPIQFIETMLRDFLLCSHHRPVIMELSAMIQAITLRCPGALVWCGLSGEDRDSITLLAGGPLEYMPVLPSQLPMPSNNRRHNEMVRKHLRNAEQEIVERSKHSERRWIADKWQRKTIESTINEVILSTLSILDAHCFDRLDGNNNNLTSLYMKLFQPVEKVIKQETFEHRKIKETRITYMIRMDEPIVKVLCEWAVSYQRFGEHRAMVVAWLLEKRQSDITAVESLNPNDDGDSNDSVGFYNGLPIFQRNLMSFLDHDAPVLEDNCDDQIRIQFTNLVHLFCELIRHDVFSYDAYMCTLISRGELLTLPFSTLDVANTPTVNSNTMTAAPPTISTLPPTTPASRVGDDILPPMEFKQKIEELDDSNVDDDLDKILQNIKVDQQDLMDAPDSPTRIEPNATNDTKSELGDIDIEQPKISRHYVYTKHFPLYQDDTTQHDCNQRYILLFGVGKERDDKKHAVKKMAKEISKLYSKKFSMDMNEGGKVKKQSRSECNLEATMTRFQSMTYFDQHMVTWQCSATILEMLSSFAGGSYNYLPVQEHVAYLFDLMEACNNVYGLIDLCISIMKELPQVESQLVQKSSSFVKMYTTSLSLYVVGVMRRYHRCLLLSYEQVLPIFEGLCRVAKHVNNPSECTSAERCILVYLLDLYSSCSLLKSKPPASETFFNIYAKVKQVVAAAVQPMPAECYYDQAFMLQIFMNPPRGGKIDSTWGRILNENQTNRYSFVCNALIAISRETDNDRLNDISIMCAEFTAHCNALSSEWLGAFIALCGSSNDGFYAHIPEHIDVQKVAIHNSLAVFVSILVARRCFSLEKFIFYVALPALVNAYKGGREISAGAEAGARLSCHLLYRLCKAVELPIPSLYGLPVIECPIKIPGPQCNIKFSCDRHLLAATHRNLAVGPVLAVLKGILVVGDAMNPENQKQPTSNKRGNRNTATQPTVTPAPKTGSIDISHILGTSELGTNNTDEDTSMQDATQEASISLSEFADHVLKQIAYQEWVLERILQNAEDLCQNGMLIDPLLTSKQAQRLLQLICFPDKEASELHNMDQSTTIQRFFQILDRWNMPILSINLQLMHKQSSNTVSETNKYLDAVARSAVEIYYTPKQKKPKKLSKKSKSGDSKQQLERPKVPEHGPGIWCVIPLLAKLPGTVQARIIKVAGQLMEKMNFFNVYRHVEEEDESDEDSDDDQDEDESDEEDENDNKSSQSEKKTEQAGEDSEDEFFYPQPAKLANREFFSLLLNCLKGHEDQRDVLLSSLHKQLVHFVRSAQEKTDINYFGHPEAKLDMIDALDLRLALVGTLFDGIYRNLSITTDWSVLLTQLMCNGVIDLQTNTSLYPTVYDMLTTIIHASLAHDPYERDENKKHFVNLVKKVRKEIGEKASRTKQTVRQLLPIVRMPRHVIAVESKCQYPGIELIDRVPGLRATEKQKVNTWDLIEGNSKNPAPLSWSWFGAVKMERKPLKYERGFELLKYHTHNLAKQRSFFYESIKVQEPAPMIQNENQNMGANMNVPGTSMVTAQMDIKMESSAMDPSVAMQMSQPQQQMQSQQQKLQIQRPKKSKAAVAAAAAVVAAQIQEQISMTQQQQQLSSQQQEQMQQFMQQNQQQGGFPIQPKNNMGTAMSVDSGNGGQVGNQQNSQQQFAFMMQQQQQQQQQNQNQMMNTPMQSALQQPMNQSQNQSQPNQMNMPTGNNQLANQLVNQMPNQIGNQMNSNQMGNQINSQMNNNQINNGNQMNAQNMNQMQMNMQNQMNPNMQQFQQLQNQMQQMPQQSVQQKQQSQQSQMLQSSASNVIPPTNMPNISTAGGSMNPQMNQMTSQINMQSKVAAPMMNQGGMQSNVGPGGMPFATGNMPSMMQGNTMPQQQSNQPNQPTQQGQSNIQQLSQAQRQQQLVNQMMHQQQLDTTKQQNNPLNNAMQNQNSNTNQQQAMSQQQGLSQQQGMSQQQINSQQQQQQWNFNQMPTTSAQNPATTAQPPQAQQQQQQFFNQTTVGQPMNRFERPQISNQSKQALTMMLQARQRNPNSFINNPQQMTGLPFSMQQQARQQFMRNASIRNMNPNQMATSGSNPINNPMMSGGGMIQRQQQQQQQQQSQMNATMQAGANMMTPSVVPMNQPGNSGMGIGPNQAIAQRQQAQNPSTAILNQAMNAGNMSALQQMKQNQQQLDRTGVFSGLVQQRQQQQQAQTQMINPSIQPGLQQSISQGQPQANQPNMNAAQAQQNINRQFQNTQFNPIGQQQQQQQRVRGPAPPYNAQFQRQNPNIAAGNPNMMAGMGPTPQQIQQQRLISRQQMLLQQQQQAQQPQQQQQSQNLGMQTPALLAQLQRQQNQYSHQPQQY